MRVEQSLVKKFHEAAGIEVNKHPVIPSKSTQLLRVRLIREELDELDAGFVHDDIVEVADAIADLLYVVLGTAVSCGISIEQVFWAVHSSNMSKFKDGYRDEGGKWIKGPSYVPAKVREVLATQSE